MRIVIFIVVVMIWLLPGRLFAQDAAKAGAVAPPSADELFASGKFAEAGNGYAAMVNSDPKNYTATYQLGYIALLSNRFGDAETWLKKAIALKPDAADAKILLAETYYRQDDFPKAAQALQGVDPKANAKMLAQHSVLDREKLASFGNTRPYQIQGLGERGATKFLLSEPLPLVRVRVNDDKEVIFFLDTGAAEVLLDADYARELKIPQFAKGQGTFAGGNKADVSSGRINSLVVANWTIKNVPVQILNLRALSSGLGVKRIDGCIGTVLFYHFLTTLDYQKQELILRRRTPENRQRFEESLLPRDTAVPFWMASDHFMVTWATINQLEPTLLFVDTGLAGAGAKLGDTFIKKAAIPLRENEAEISTGGGGQIKSVPFTLQSLAIGAAKQQAVGGYFEGPFPWENVYGFYLPGMAGHNYFKKYAVTFDFENMKLYLKP